ncbi:zinc-ribbon domain-containing protein [Desulfobacula sp.]|uniref:zinc-ribbon domain-containing protein n=1 Tax=Desulfobacula sp. TaxID=2593537 RepID=UPI00260C9CC5|nr:zinc-ribbon domain-containing protein [Desulfobacula sp.]
MIITCNKCSTSFNLDDSLVKEDGSKVRCSVCKHIFTAFPLPRESEQESEESSDLNLESFPDDDDTLEEPSDFETEESDFSLKSSDLETESSDLEMDETDLGMDETDLEVDDDFSFEETELEIDEDGESQELEFEESHWEFDGNGIEFEDSEEEDFDSIEFETIEDEPASLDSTESEPDLKMEDETDLQASDYQTFDENLEDDSLAGEDEFELEFDIEDDSENEASDIPDDEMDEDLLETETELEDYSLEEETETDDYSLKEEIIEIDDTQEKAPVEKPEPVLGTTPRSRKKKKKPLVGAPVLVMLLIFFLVIGAYIASGMTGYKIPYLSDIKIPFIEQYFKKAVPEKLDVKPVPNQKSVNGRFVTNSTAGTLFVITGRVENLSNIAYSHIEIRGALITKGKVEAKTKNTFCGNIITEEMLKTGNISDINKLLAIKKGNHNSNVNIKPGAGVPFMVVFSDLPEKLQNFTVKVIRFEKTKNN